MLPYGGKAAGHLTTRQNFQLHFVALEHTDDALAALAAAGLTTREACGNSVRKPPKCARLPIWKVATDSFCRAARAPRS